MIRRCLCLVACLLFLYGCRIESAIYGHVSVPLKGMKHYQVYNMVSAVQVIADSTQGSPFTFSLDSLPKGIYQLFVSWDKDTLKAAEVKRLERHQVGQLPRYSLSQSFWLDPEEQQLYRFTVSGTLTQENLETHLLSQAVFPIFCFEPTGNTSKTFSAFNDIYTQYRMQYVAQKDSLVQLMYAMNEQGDLEAAKKYNRQSHQLWTQHTEVELRKAEMVFLAPHRSRAFIPFVLYQRIVSKEAFARYKDIYNLLSAKQKQELEKAFLRFQ